MKNVEGNYDDIIEYMDDNPNEGLPHWDGHGDVTNRESFWDSTEREALDIDSPTYDDDFREASENHHLARWLHAGLFSLTATAVDSEHWDDPFVFVYNTVINDYDDIATKSAKNHLHEWTEMYNVEMDPNPHLVLF